MTKLILDNIKVIDLTFWLPGPFCSRMLADMGAEVIKIERRLLGDPLRLAKPLVNGESKHFARLNRNKKSMALNLRRPAGQKIFFELAKTADIVIENFRPGQVDRLGIGYNHVRQHNPQIIYCSLSGYGQEGPYAGRPGHDLTYAALAGLLDSWSPSGPAVMPAVPLADLSGALFAAIGILGALYRRQISGRGAYLDVSMLDALMGLVGDVIGIDENCGRTDDINDLFAGKLPGYNVYQTQDEKWMALGAIEPVFWNAFCTAVGRDDLSAMLDGDEVGRQAVIDEVRSIFAGRTREAWIEFFAGIGVCCEPVLSLEDALNHPQVRQRGLVFYQDHPAAGRIRQLHFPLDFGLERSPAKPAPLLGQHTEEIMLELGYSDTDMIELQKQKIIATPDSANKGISPESSL
ncbi:MAG: CoA transferase [Anaerolineales bacterium]|nr:CoA transferase [Anaerolineales bacterium]